MAEYTPRPAHRDDFVPSEHLLIISSAAARCIPGAYFLEQAEAAAKRGIAKIKAEAWDEGNRHAWLDGEDAVNPYRDEATE